METTQAIIFLVVGGYTGGISFYAFDYVLQLIWND